MANFDYSCNVPMGTLYLVREDGSFDSFPYGIRCAADARFDCRDWLLKRPDFVFASVVYGPILVAKAGCFPWSVDGVSLAPLAC